MIKKGVGRSVFATSEYTRPLACLIAFFFFFVNAVTAQDYKTDFEKAMNIYKEKAFEIQMEYLFFPSQTATKPQEREMMILKKQGDEFYSNQFGLEMVCNNRYVLMIDEAKQIIAIDHKPKQNGKPDPELTAKIQGALKNLATSLGIDSVSKDAGYTVTYAGIKNGLKEYIIDYKYGEYEKTVCYIDPKQGDLKRMTLFYREPMEVEEGKTTKVRVEINYIKQLANPVFSKDAFSMEKYIDLQKDGEVKLKEKYKTYTVINHLVKPKLD
jgi:hypothetical protein